VFSKNKYFENTLVKRYNILIILLTRKSTYHLLRLHLPRLPLLVLHTTVHLFHQCKLVLHRPLPFSFAPLSFQISQISLLKFLNFPNLQKICIIKLYFHLYFSSFYLLQRKRIDFKYSHFL